MKTIICKIWSNWHGSVCFGNEKGDIQSSQYLETEEEWKELLKVIKHEIKQWDNEKEE